MARDVRAALPNSVRVRVNGTLIVIEMMNTIDGARYRSTGSLTTPDQDLDFSAADNKFTTVGRFGTRRPPPAGYVGYLAIYAISAAEIYSAPPGVMSGPGQLFIDANPLNADEDQVTLSSAFKFKYQSPSQRVYLVSGPITYLCDTTARTMRRYEGYSIATSQANRDTDAELMAAGATRSLVANDVGACQFDYTNGTPTRAALVTLSLTLTRTTPGNAAESVRLLRQVHMENTP
jgi:MSHA biogenesis protein MshO